MSETIQDKEKAPLKVKKPKKLSKKTQETIKVDLSKKQEDAIQTQKTDDSNAVVEEKKDETSGKKVVEEVRATKEEVETPIIEEIKEEVEETTKELKEAIRDEKVVGKQLPENIEKLVTFMEETGGNVEDYVRLNADYSKLEDDALLNEYYKRTKPHLNSEEINFMLEDNFTWDEEVEEERDIRKKKLALKEEIAKAKNFLEDTKSKYYDEIKLRPGVTQEQQKATEFFNRYNNEQQTVQKQHEEFKNTTKNYFTKDFKGFEFSLGEKRFSYNVQNPETVADNQSNLTNFVKTFLDDKGNVKDYEGYHKAIYAARNADTIANHFYEQGKADAIKDVTAKSKNINQDVRSTTPGDLFINGLKVKAVNGVDSSKLRVKSKKNK